MNTKKLAIYIITPVLGVAAVTAVTIPNVVSPISQTGASTYNRTIVLDSSTNAIFDGMTGNQSAGTNTPTGDTMTFSVKYVTPAGVATELPSGGHTAANNYTMRASFNNYWCYLTHDKPFSDLSSVATTYTPEMGDRIEYFALYASSEPFTSFPNETDKIDRVNAHGVNWEFSVGEGKHYFALAYRGYYNNGSANYYIDISQIAIKYIC